ncbi:hypothetical protein EYF80_038912 [Liparis tanakae]|uniref:Uncharacterized protein n=1 Tax=Liparis tanakae TaxID=230148 RepID=A0A4Z2GBA7_9TELE|nr:hypothetical protein EYF80_038912 [Liparis tanakae]
MGLSPKSMQGAFPHNARQSKRKRTAVIWEMRSSFCNMHVRSQFKSYSLAVPSNHARPQHRARKLALTTPPHHVEQSTKPLNAQITLRHEGVSQDGVRQAAASGDQSCTDSDGQSGRVRSMNTGSTVERASSVI